MMVRIPVFPGTAPKLPGAIPARRISQKTMAGQRVPGWEHISIIRLAKALGSNPTHIRAILTGRRTPSVYLARRLAGALGLTWDQFFASVEASRQKDEERRERKGLGTKFKGELT